MSAIFSPCGRFRYRLDRKVADTGVVAALVGVNPSTAGAVENDQTIRKDLGFARLHGWRRIVKGNLFGYRATDVRALASAPDPIGPDNDQHLISIFYEVDIVVAAWGPTAKLPARLRNRWRTVLELAEACGKEMWSFGVAQDGQPRHTLMLPYSTPLVPWPSLA